MHHQASVSLSCQTPSPHLHTATVRSNATKNKAKHFCKNQYNLTLLICIVSIQYNLEIANFRIGRVAQLVKGERHLQAGWSGRHSWITQEEGLCSAAGEEGEPALQGPSGAVLFTSLPRKLRKVSPLQ